MGHNMYAGLVPNNRGQENYLLLEFTLLIDTFGNMLPTNNAIA
jgi:hypothetical protein